MPARSDQTSDTALRAELLQARRGQAYFSRKLNELNDDDFDAPSSDPKRSRRYVIAYLGLHARRIAVTIEEAIGLEVPDYDLHPAIPFDVEFASTLPAQALRNLNAHAAVHLNVTWRDLPEAEWGRFRFTVSERSEALWLGALNLNNGAIYRDIPPLLANRLRAAGQIIEET